MEATTSSSPPTPPSSEQPPPPTPAEPENDSHVEGSKRSIITGCQMIIVAIILAVPSALLVPRWLHQDQDQIAITGEVIAYIFTALFILAIIFMLWVICLERAGKLTKLSAPDSTKLDIWFTKGTSAFFAALTVVFDVLEAVSLRECLPVYEEYGCAGEGHAYIVYRVFKILFIFVQTLLVCLYYKVSFRRHWCIQAAATISIPMNILIYFYTFSREVGEVGSDTNLVARTCNATAGVNATSTHACVSLSGNKTGIEKFLDDWEFVHFPVLMEFTLTMSGILAGLYRNMKDARPRQDGNSGESGPQAETGEGSTRCSKWCRIMLPPLGLLVFIAFFITILYYIITIIVSVSNHDLHYGHVIVYNYLWIAFDLQLLVYSTIGAVLCLKRLKPAPKTDHCSPFTHPFEARLEFLAILAVLILIMLNTLAAASYLHHQDDSDMRAVAVSILVEAGFHIVGFLALLCFLAVLHRSDINIQRQRTGAALSSQLEWALFLVNNIVLLLALITLLYYICYFFELHAHDIQPIQELYYNHTTHPEAWHTISYAVYPFCIYFFFHIFKHLLLEYLQSVSTRTDCCKWCRRPQQDPQPQNATHQPYSISGTQISSAL